MSMKAIGKTMSSKAMGYSDLQTAQFIRESSPAASLTEKENILIKLSNSMIFENIADLGQTASLLDMAKQFITMEMCMKEIFWKESDAEWGLTASTKSISTWEIGNKIHSGAKENFLEMIRCFLKEISKKA